MEQRTVEAAFAIGLMTGLLITLTVRYGPGFAF